MESAEMRVSLLIMGVLQIVFVGSGVYASKMQVLKLLSTVLMLSISPVRVIFSCCVRCMIELWRLFEVSVFVRLDSRSISIQV